MGNIRVGVVGIGRGSGFARGAGRVGMELVALCDTREERLRNVGQELGVSNYTDYDKFSCGMHSMWQCEQKLHKRKLPAGSSATAKLPILTCAREFLRMRIRGVQWLSGGGNFVFLNHCYQSP